MATCPETSQAMQHYDADPHLHRPNGGMRPNLLESVELNEVDEQTMRDSFCPLGIIMMTVYILTCKPDLGSVTDC